MTMVSSGPISIGGSATTGGFNQSINIEIGRAASATTSLNEPIVRSVAQKPTGAIALSDFYGKGLLGKTWGTKFLRFTPRGGLYANNLYVLVGSGIWTSPDGINWTNRVYLPTTVTVTGPAWNGSIFVAGISAGPNVGSVYTSPDGITWTLRTTDSTAAALGVASGGSLFVLGRSGTNFVSTSTDGITWTSRTVPATVSVNLIAYGGGRFVAYTGNTTSSIMYSTDGINWTINSGVSFNLLTRSITYGAGLFVVSGNTRHLLSSPDGITWTSRATGLPTGYNYPAVFWTGTRFVLATAQTPALLVGGIYQSADGITWAAATSNPTKIKRPLAVFLGSSSARVVGVAAAAASTSTDGGLIFTESLSGADTVLNTIVYASSIPRWVAAGGSASSGNGSVNTSTDGVTWVNQTGTNFVFNSLIWTGAQFVAACTSLAMTSPDGITWTSRTCSIYGYGVAYSGSVYVIVGANYSANTIGTYSTSADGATWNTPVVGATGYAIFRGVIWAGGQFVAVCDSGIIRTSPNGTTWTDRVSNLTLTSRINAIAWNGSLYVVCNATGQIATSPDGITWTPRTSGVTTSLNSAYWTGYLFCVGGANGTVLSSFDGITWTASVTADSALTVNGIAGSPQRVIGVGTNGAMCQSTPNTTATF